MPSAAARWGLTKAGGVTSAEGNVGLALIACDSSMVAPGSTAVSPGALVFSDGPGQFQSHVLGNFGAIDPTSTLVTMRLLRSGNNFSSFVDNVPVSSGTHVPANPLTFMISLCAGTCISTPDPAERTAFRNRPVGRCLLPALALPVPPCGGGAAAQRRVRTC